MQDSDKFIIAEQKIIHLMLNNKKAIEDVLESKITSNLFSDRHQFLVSCIYQEYLDNKANFPRLLTRGSYEHFLLKKIGKEGEILVHLKNYDACLIKISATIDDISKLKTDILDGYAARKANIAFEEYEKERVKDGHYKAAQKLTDRLNVISSSGGENKTFFVNIKDAKNEYYTEKENQRNNPQKLIKCGITPFDDAMVGGLAPQTLTLVVADSGTGKTSCMLSMAINIVKSGHDILFVSLEMNKIRLMDRILSNVHKIDFSKISQPDKFSNEEYEDFKNKLDEWDKIQGNFIIMEASEWVTVSSLRREIEVRAMTYKPEVVFIDYIGMLKPENRYKDRYDLELGEISKSLRFLGKKYGFATVSACQLNREAIRRMRKSKENLAGTEDLRGSGELSNDSDFIFALFPTPEGNKLKGQTIKSRYGKSHNTFNLCFDGSICKVSNSEDLMPSVLKNMENLDKDFSDDGGKEEASLDDLDSLDFGG